MIAMYEWMRVRAVAASVCLLVYGVIMLLYPNISGTVYQAALIAVLLAAWIGAMIWLQMKGREPRNSN